MVADLSHVFSCIRLSGENMSFCCYFNLRVSRRRHDKQRATPRKISTRRHKIFNKEIFVPLPVKMSLFHLVYFVFSSLLPESRKKDKKTCLVLKHQTGLFVILSGRKAKTQNISFMIDTQSIYIVVPQELEILSIKKRYD